MYFSSDSWGKLGKSNKKSNEFDEIAEDFLKSFGVDYSPIYSDAAVQQTSHLLHAITNNFGKPSLNAMSNIERMKYILEVMTVPVKNPKTGEMDYIDINLVDKIVVNSQYVHDMIEEQKKTASFKLIPNPAEEAESHQVTIEVVVDGRKQSAQISLQQFEEILYEAVNVQQNQRLEEVPAFKELCDNLMKDIVLTAHEENTYFAIIDEDYVLEKGIGVIFDKEAEQLVGTFEEMKYLYNRNEGIFNIEGVMLSDRSYEDMQERDRYHYVFYSQEKNRIYEVAPVDGSAIKVDTVGRNAIDMRNVGLIIEPFPFDHPYRDVVSKAQNAKAFIHGLTPEDPTYEASYEKLVQARMDILEESKAKQRKEKIKNQFADIDFDLDF